MHSNEAGMFFTPILRLRTAGAAAIFAAGLIFPTSSFAGVLFDNPWRQPFQGGGYCSFNTACAGQLGEGNDFAAQSFHTDSSATVRSASWTEMDNATPSSSANWGFWTVGPSGLPGALIASGSSPVLQTVTLATYTIAHTTTDLNQVFFDVPDVALVSGDYYFAIQSSTTTFEIYLGPGELGSGAAETHDGGSSWSPLYVFWPSVPVALYDTPVAVAAVPEPSSWAMMILGFFGICSIAYRRRRGVAGIHEVGADHRA